VIRIKLYGLLPIRAGKAIVSFVIVSKIPVIVDKPYVIIRFGVIGADAYRTGVVDYSTVISSLVPMGETPVKVRGGVIGIDAYRLGVCRNGFVKIPRVIAGNAPVIMDGGITGVFLLPFDKEQRCHHGKT
jgi:hypothetical protein